jgi:hypothetical protein
MIYTPNQELEIFSGANQDSLFVTDREDSTARGRDGAFAAHHVGFPELVGSTASIHLAGGTLWNLFTGC